MGWWDYARGLWIFMGVYDHPCKEDGTSGFPAQWATRRGKQCHCRCQAVHKVGALKPSQVLILWVSETASGLSQREIPWWTTLLMVNRHSEVWVLYQHGSCPTGRLRSDNGYGIGSVFRGGRVMKGFPSGSRSVVSLHLAPRFISCWSAGDREKDAHGVTARQLLEPFTCLRVVSTTVVQTTISRKTKGPSWWPSCRGSRGVTWGINRNQ